MTVPTPGQCICKGKVQDFRKYIDLLFAESTMRDKYEAKVCTLYYTTLYTLY